jgi:hypothetical protein
MYGGALRSGAIAASAADVTAGQETGFAQGVALACDLVMDQIVKGVPVSAAAVPLVMTQADCVQFGAAFAMEPNFPCCVMLSQPLPLLCHDTRTTICHYMLALARFYERHAALLSGALSLTPYLDKCVLSTERYFLKAVETHDTRRARYELVHLMETFQLLHQHEPCRKFVVFPVGHIGLPQEGSALHRAVVRVLGPRAKIAKETTLPIVGVELRGADLLLARVQRLLHAKARVILAAVEAAGVIHLDVRLANIMVRSVLAGAGDVCSSLELRLTEWDTSERVDPRIAPQAIQAHSTDPGKRYPRDVRIASPEYHAFSHLASVHP